MMERVKDTESGILDVSPQLQQSRENQFTASYRQELSYFVDAVRAERSIDTPVEQIALMKIVEGAYLSAERGGDVKL